MRFAEPSAYADEYRRLMALIDQLQPHGEPRIRWVYRASKYINSNGKRLGIFSGSFNPLTLAHVKMIEAAQADFNLEEVLLLLAKANVDKDVFGLSLADRLLTLKLYAVSRENFSVAVCSHGRFIEKIEALQIVYPHNTHFSFIVGYDTFVRIFDPKYYTDMHGALQALFDQCRLIVANRNKDNVDSVRKFLDTPEHRRYASYIDLVELPSFYAGISSTAVRIRLERGDSIDHLVPPMIQEFIRATHAYRPK